jgi:hypothetical protein
LLFFIAVIFFSPALILGSGKILVFWKSNWYLLLILVSVMVVFDSYYLVNRRLYCLLEREDWPALVHYLEEKIYRQRKYSKRLVRLLANTYLVLSDSPGVMSLENKAALAKPSLVDDNALVFGTARILGKDVPGAIRFFEGKLNTAKPDLRQWIRWYYAFALLLDSKFEKAVEEFSHLIKISNDGIITGLSAFFLGNNIMKSLPEKKPVLESAAAEGRDRVLKALPQQADWGKEVVKIKAEIHAAVLAQFMEEAGQWLYRSQAAVPEI